MSDGGTFVQGQDFVVNIRVCDQVNAGEESVADSNTAIFYTFDGTEPTRNSLQIENGSGIPGHLLMNYCRRSQAVSSCQLKVIAITKGKSPSPVCSAVFWFPRGHAELPALQTIGMPAV